MQRIHAAAFVSDSESLQTHRNLHFIFLSKNDQ